MATNDNHRKTAAGAGNTAAKKSSGTRSTSSGRSASSRTGSSSGSRSQSTATRSGKTSQRSGQRAYVGNARDGRRAAKPVSKAGSGEPKEYEQLKLTLEKDNSLRDEIVVILVLLVCVLFVLSYLGLCGSFGITVNKVIFGLFGAFGYAFPFVMFFVALFAVANRTHASVVSKTVYCVCMMLFISALVQMAVGGFNPDISFKDYFVNSIPGYDGADRTYGGFLGGAICKLLCPYVGNVGAVCIMIAAVLIFFLLVVGKAIFTGIARAGAENARIRREERESEEEWDNIRLDEAEPVREIRNRRRRSEDEEDDLYPELDDAFFEEQKRRDRKKKSGDFVDSLMRRGMGLEIGRIADTPEYAKLKEEYGETDFEVSEIESDKRETVTGDDIVASELNKKFANKSGLDVPYLRERPSGTGTGITRTLMVDGEEESPSDNIVAFKNRFEPADAPEAVADENRHESADTSDTVSTSEADSTSPAIRSAAESRGTVRKKTGTAVDGSDTAEAGGNEDKRLESRTSSSSTSFTTPEQLAELREEQEQAEKRIPYEFPPIDLLNRGKPPVRTAAGMNELKETVGKLQKTFESFGVGVTVTDATCGPTVTRYELLPDQGVKVKTITSLADDIKLALAAAEIRIEAPIPGKAAVGIEVPNSTTSPVLLRDLLESGDFKDAQSNLTFAVGKDIGGKTICFDIASMPHMLIAGATGSGKSVCINALILSIIYKAKPTDVRMIMIDPKRVELIGYNGIPHLLVPVVTDVKKATGALNWAIAEMDDRYERFANAGVNNLASYNRLMEEKYFEEGNEGECPDRLPQILIIVDELNDLMMTANSKEVEASICRLTQLARASGIHVVLATQRPSVNVITGTIKANIPSRIAFSVSSIVDSRTIIDQAGAEKLLGKGDMLFYPQGYPKPVRLQGAYVSDKEIAAVVDFIKSKCREVKYSEAVSRHIDNNSAGSGKNAGSDPAGSATAATAGDGDGHDELFEQAGCFIIEKQKASIGMLQRVYKIGFNRAARIMDQLAEEGVVGPEEGTKPRRILMTMQQFKAYLDGDIAGEDSDGEEMPEQPVD